MNKKYHIKAYYHCILLCVIISLEYVGNPPRLDKQINRVSTGVTGEGMEVIIMLFMYWYPDPKAGTLKHTKWNKINKLCVWRGLLVVGVGCGWGVGEEGDFVYNNVFTDLHETGWQSYKSCCWELPAWTHFYHSHRDCLPSHKKWR